jgi:hypothetical protein
MPRNYANAVIYKIARRDGHGESYVGSTCDLRTRRKTHKHTCTSPNHRGYGYPVYQHIRDNGGWDEWECVPIEAFPCETKTELEIRERHWVDTLKPALNVQKPAAVALAGGKAEYAAEYYAKYYAANREKIAEKIASYQAANREKIAKQQAEYYVANRERIAEKQAERVTCECGSVIARGGLAVHQRTAKHIRAMAQ